MGLTSDYQKFLPAGFCNAVASSNGAVQALDNVTCIASVCENANIYNVRTGEIVDSVSRDNHQVTTILLSPNKRYLAVGYDDGDVHLFDRETHSKAEPVIFSGHKRGVNTLAFSHDGFSLASGGKDSVIIVWDILNEMGKFRLNGHMNSVTQLQFTRDDKYLVSTSKDTTVKFWNLSTQSCFYVISDSTSELYGFALVKQDRLLVLGCAEIELIVYELTWLAGADLEEEKPDAPAAKASKCLPGAVHLDEDADQGNTIVRSRRRGTLLRQARGRALQLKVTKDEFILMVLGGDRIMDVYRIYTEEDAERRFAKKVRKVLKRKAAEGGPADDGVEAEISQDVTSLVARIGDYRTEAKIKWIDVVNRFVDREGARTYSVYCLMLDNTVQRISLSVDFTSNEVYCRLANTLDKRGHREDVRCLAMAHDNNTFVSGAGDSAIVWSLQTLLPRNRLVADGLRDLTAAFYVPGNRYVVFGSKAGVLYVFDLTDCSLVSETKAHEGAIWSMAGLPEQDGFVTGGSDKQACFWEYKVVVEIGVQVLRIKNTRSLELEDEILCVAVSPNCKFVVLGLLDFTAKVHYVDSLKFFLSLYGHSLPVMCVDVDDESRLVVTGSSDKGCKIWGLDFGDCHKSLYGHSDAVTAVKFGRTTEEKLFFSASKDGTVVMWDAVRFHKIQVLEGHFADVRALAITSTGSTLISAAADKSIRVWDQSEELVVLEERDQADIEREYLAKMIDAEDVVPGEASEAEAQMAAKKSLETIKGTELIMEAVDVARAQRKLEAVSLEHPLITAYKSASLDHFLLDAVARVPSTHLEKSLVAVPFDYVRDVIAALTACVRKQYRLELAVRVILFLFKVHHTYVAQSRELFVQMDQIRVHVPDKVTAVKKLVAFNAAALRLLKLGLEERDNIQIFKDVSEVEKTAQRGGRRALVRRAA